jgi:hypothetical protein
VLKRIYTILAVIGFFAVYAIIGAIDLADQERAEAHKREVIAAAKAEFKRQQLQGLIEEGERMTFPIAAYGKQ